MDGADAAVDVPIDVPILPSRPAAAPLIQWVNPFMGTGGAGFGTGSTFPGPQVPFGLARPGPDTTDPTGAVPFMHCSGFAYGDSQIQGFSMTRMNGTGIPEYGAVGFMPVVGMTAAKTSQGGYLSAYDHATERASPGYYAVHLNAPDVQAELTATAHVGLARFTYPSGSDAVFLLDVGHTFGDVQITGGQVQVDPPNREISGWTRFSAGYSGRIGGVVVYFAARTSRSFARFGTWAGGVPQDGVVARDGADTGAYVGFDTSTDRSVTVALGVSFVDVAHARMNLLAEASDTDFERVRAAAEVEWERSLGTVRIEGRNEADFRTFYSALYHTLLMPTLASDVDGTYRGLDRQVHTATGFRYYTDFSLWDTYRTEHPLLTWLQPAYQTEFLRSLAAMGQDLGWMPRWPMATGETGGMLGESADIVFADSWSKGLRAFDLRQVYTVLRRTAVSPVPAGINGRDALASYETRGYCSIESTSASAATTLEFAYDDAALAVLADALGETADAGLFRQRSGNWRNLLDPSNGFLLGRHDDGSFSVPTNFNVWNDAYAEGNAWHYRFFVPHQIVALGDALGGRPVLLAALDQMFDSSRRAGTNTFLPGQYYWQGNEPDIHTPWMYAALGDGARTARWTHWVARNFFASGPTGLPGNDDGGTMSAWFVFASMGVFPIAGTTDYLLGSPMFTRVEVRVGGSVFVIDAPEESEAALYVQHAELNGAPLTEPRLDHARLVANGTLRLTMAATAP